jgi:hypothetical protein
METSVTDILQRLVQALPSMTHWIDELLAQHAANAKPVADAKSARLPLYYPSSMLNAARVVQVSAFPRPPVENLGLPEFLPFATMPMAGVTYCDMFFVRESDTSDALIQRRRVGHVFGDDLQHCRKHVKCARRIRRLCGDRRRYGQRRRQQVGPSRNTGVE